MRKYTQKKEQLTKLSDTTVEKLIFYREHLAEKKDYVVNRFMFVRLALISSHNSFLHMQKQLRLECYTALKETISSEAFSTRFIYNEIYDSIMRLWLRVLTKT